MSVVGRWTLGPARTILAFDNPNAPGKRGRSYTRKNLSLRRNILFTTSDLAQSVRQLFMNFPPVADGEDPENPCFTMQFVDDAKSSDFEDPQSPTILR